jgi:hypothetical protein
MFVISYLQKLSKSLRKSASTFQKETKIQPLCECENLPVRFSCDAPALTVFQRWPRLPPEGDVEERAEIEVTQTSSGSNHANHKVASAKRKSPDDPR